MMCFALNGLPNIQAFFRMTTWTLLRTCVTVNFDILLFISNQFVWYNTVCGDGSVWTQDERAGGGGAGG